MCRFPSWRRSAWATSANSFKNSSGRHTDNNIIASLGKTAALLRHLGVRLGSRKGDGMKTALIIMLIGALLASARSAQAKEVRE